MIISIINHSDLDKHEVQNVIRAVNRQLKEDFKQYWHKDVELRLEGWTGNQPDSDKPIDMRGDAVLYLWDETDADDALGYHSLSDAGVPYGFVFIHLTDGTGEHWSKTLSHEAIELAMDTEVNLLAFGPHPDPAEGGRKVYHWYEVCDPVQEDSYTIDGVLVSNFVLPLYFTPDDEHKNHNDFLGTGLKSFGVNKGGYLGFFDPKTGKNETYYGPDDELAVANLERKKPYKLANRSGKRILKASEN